MFCPGLQRSQHLNSRRSWKKHCIPSSVLLFRRNKDTHSKKNLLQRSTLCITMSLQYYYVKNFSDLLLSWRKQSKRLVPLASNLTSVLYTPYYCSSFIEKLLLSWSSLQSTLRSALTTFTKISDKCYDHIHATFKISESIQAQRNLIDILVYGNGKYSILTLQSPSCSGTSQYTGCILKPMTTAYI